MPLQSVIAGHAPRSTLSPPNTPNGETKIAKGVQGTIFMYGEDTTRKFCRWGNLCSAEFIVDERYRVRAFLDTEVRDHQVSAGAYEAANGRTVHGAVAYDRPPTTTTPSSPFCQWWLSDAGLDHDTVRITIEAEQVIPEDARQLLASLTTSNCSMAILQRLVDGSSYPYRGQIRFILTRSGQTIDDAINNISDEPTIPSPARAITPPPHLDNGTTAIVDYAHPDPSSSSGPSTINGHQFDSLRASSRDEECFWAPGRSRAANRYAVPDDPPCPPLSPSSSSISDTSSGITFTSEDLDEMDPGDRLGPVTDDVFRGGAHYTGPRVLQVPRARHRGGNGAGRPRREERDGGLASSLQRMTIGSGRKAEGSRRGAGAREVVIHQSAPATAPTTAPATAPATAPTTAPTSPFTTPEDDESDWPPTMIEYTRLESAQELRSRSLGAQPRVLGPNSSGGIRRQSQGSRRSPALCRENVARMLEGRM